MEEDALSTRQHNHNLNNQYDQHDWSGPDPLAWLLLLELSHTQNTHAKGAKEQIYNANNILIFIILRISISNLATSNSSI